MAVEILTVSLSDESIEAIAQRVARMLNGGTQPTTQSNPPSPETHRTQSDPVQGGQADPWTGEPPADDGGWPQGAQPAPPRQNQGYNPAPPQPGQAVVTPTCAHGPMRYVAAGFSKSTGRAYPAFYGCQAPRGAPDKCKSVQAA